MPRRGACPPDVWTSVTVVYRSDLRGVYSDTTQLNPTELTSGQRPVYDGVNKNTTDLLRADWLYAVQLGQFS